MFIGEWLVRAITSESSKEVAWEGVLNADHPLYIYDRNLDSYWMKTTEFTSKLTHAFKKRYHSFPWSFSISTKGMYCGYKGVDGIKDIASAIPRFLRSILHMEHQRPTRDQMFYDTENPNSGAVPSPYYRGLTRNIRYYVTHRDNDTTEPNHPFDIQQQPHPFFSRLWIEPGAQRRVIVGHGEIHFPVPSNLQPLREIAGALSRNHGEELRIDVSQAGGEAATIEDIFEASIDIWDDNRYCTDRTDHLITYQAWREHLSHLKRSRVDDSSVDMMSETAAALGGQTIGTLVAVALTSSSASSPAVYSVEFIIVLGLICTLAGISLRRKRRAWSVLMTKIGVMATISAVIMSLAAHLPPVMMLTVGPVAFLILAASVALA